MKMGERVFWIDENEEGSEEFESSHGSDHDDYSSNLPPHHSHLLPQDAGNNSRQSPASASESSSSPIGLTLTKTPSFLSLLQRRLSKGKNPAKEDHGKPAPEKLKASNFPAVFIEIGSWRRTSMHQGDLVAKLYYAKRKLVWELLDGALKSKIEMQWSDIVAIRATTLENLPGILEIEVNRPPLFYRESSPQPRKHTLWHQTTDFTSGQASIWRRHYVRFPEGVLDRHYSKLLQYDDRLAALSRRQFPSSESPYFDWHISPAHFALTFTPPLPTQPQFHQMHHGITTTMPPPPPNFIELVAPNSTIITSGMDLTLGHGGNLNRLGLSQIQPSSTPFSNYQFNNLLPESSLATAGDAQVYSFPESAGFRHYSVAAAGGLSSESANWRFAASQGFTANVDMDQNVDSNPYNLGNFNF
ncbi:uncharacterized protein LOC127239702 [Andrographis paniculata]|uniref:uncharacterized protein LOC127239702 n=1 Tax=Andrographis paniculata TaxID=175694 RepID=UPI0021E90ECF|nr:uncharacterized protein LOC127239702 [Andrographis paniculata]